MPIDEYVVLVDENDQVIGKKLKLQTHSSNTPLHRGLSVYVFRPSLIASDRQVIVQRRALHKKTWPGVWSNSCCGHPLPGETYEEAALREVKEELGIELTDFRKVSDYRYRFERNGIVENEICPVFSGVAVGEVKLDPGEVMDWKWIDWNEWMELLQKDTPGPDGEWSEWCKEEVKLFDP